MHHQVCVHHAAQLSSRAHHSLPLRSGRPPQPRASRVSLPNPYTYTLDLPVENRASRRSKAGCAHRRAPGHRTVHCSLRVTLQAPAGALHRARARPRNASRLPSYQSLTGASTEEGLDAVSRGSVREGRKSAVGRVRVNTRPTPTLGAMRATTRTTIKDGGLSCSWAPAARGVCLWGGQKNGSSLV